jgi:hypothetical protein
MAGIDKIGYLQMIVGGQSIPIYSVEDIQLARSPKWNTTQIPMGTQAIGVWEGQNAITYPFEFDLLVGWGVSSYAHMMWYVRLFHAMLSHRMVASQASSGSSDFSNPFSGGINGGAGPNSSGGLFDGGSSSSNLLGGGTSNLTGGGTSSGTGFANASGGAQSPLPPSPVRFAIGGMFSMSGILLDGKATLRGPFVKQGDKLLPTRTRFSGTFYGMPGLHADGVVYGTENNSSLSAESVIQNLYDTR